MKFWWFKQQISAARLTNSGSNFKGFHMWLIWITTQMGKSEKASGREPFLQSNFRSPQRCLNRYTHTHTRSYTAPCFCTNPWLPPCCCHPRQKPPHRQEGGSLQPGDWLCWTNCLHSSGPHSDSLYSGKEPQFLLQSERVSEQGRETEMRSDTQREEKKICLHK